MMAMPLITGQGVRGVALCEFGGSLVFVVSFRLARTM